MRDKSVVLTLLLTTSLLLLAGALPLAAQTNPVIFPTGLDFGYSNVGTGVVQTVSVYNVSGTKSITLSSITPSITQLQVVSGTLPITIGPGQRQDYGIQFLPTATGTVAGHLTFAVTGEPSQAVNTNGVGTAATATCKAEREQYEFSQPGVGDHE